MHKREEVELGLFTYVWLEVSLINVRASSWQCMYLHLLALSLLSVQKLHDTLNIENDGYHKPYHKIFSFRML